MMHKPGWRGFLIVGGVILSLLLFAVVFRARADFERIPTRLSRSTDVCDIEPRAAISADGQWLAAAWIRGKQINQGCVSRGEAVVRWANEGSSLSGWSPVTTLPLPSGACAVHVDVALAGTTAHLAVSLWNPCDAIDANSSLRYYMCDLVGGGLQFRE